MTPAMTKIGQVARAILEESKNFGGLAHRVKNPEFTIEMRLARAAIEAMREPTKAMEIAAHDEMQEFGLGRYTPIASAYRAMIEAALQERSGS